MEAESRIAIQYYYQMTMKFILFLITAIYNASLGQCGYMWSCKRVGVVKRINNNRHQLRGNSNTEIGRLVLCDNVVGGELMEFDIRNMKDGGENFKFDKLFDPHNPTVEVEQENEYEGFKVVDHKIGEIVEFYGTNLPPSCKDSDDEPWCNIILSDSPSCHDEDAFQKSKTIRQMHYITDYRGSTGDTEWQSYNSTLLKYNFLGFPGLVSQTVSAHFTDQTGKRVACAIIESEEDSEKLIEDRPSTYMSKDIRKKVVGASLVQEGPQNWQVPLSYNIVPE